MMRVAMELTRWATSRMNPMTASAPTNAAITIIHEGIAWLDPSKTIITRATTNLAPDETPSV